MQLVKIEPDDILYRRAPATTSYYVKEEVKPRHSSGVFSPRPNADENGISVNLQKFTDVMKTCEDEPNKYIVVSVPASVPLSKEYECEHAPREHNYSHSLLKDGIAPNDRGKRDKKARKIAKSELCQLIHSPENPHSDCV